MDAPTRYSVGSVVPNTDIKYAVEVLDSHSISQFWTPNAIQFDQALSNEMFHGYLKLHSIEALPIPAHHHNKNVLECKHKIIRIFS